MLHQNRMLCTVKGTLRRAVQSVKTWTVKELNAIRATVYIAMASA